MANQSSSSASMPRRPFQRGCASSAKDEHVDARAHPVAVRAQGLRHELGQVRRIERLQAFFAVQGLELRAVGLDRVGFVAAGARFGDRALQHFLGVGAPARELDSVLALESRGERREVFGHERGVDQDLALFLRPLEQEPLAVRLVVLHDLGRSASRNENR
jgi:hypothetical protein